MTESKATPVKRSQDDASVKKTEQPKAKAPKEEDSAPSAVKWLLSDEAFDLANPEIPKGHGEIDWDQQERIKKPPSEKAGKHASEAPILRYPQSSLTPFQNLVAACLLSKPISHKLCLRTIQTLLNPPFGLRTLEDLDEAGFEGRRKVMWEARTQHKEKTAAQLGDLVDGIRELNGKYQDNDDLNNLKGLHESIKSMKHEEAVKTVEEKLQKIKGVGPGVTAIFLRRVQKSWPEVFPYADDRVLAAAQGLGLIKKKEADELQKLVDGDRAKFVRLLDVLIGLDLERKMDEAESHIRDD